MATIIPARVIYTEQELSDILTTAIEGGIGYWSEVYDLKRSDKMTVTSVTIKPNEESEGDFGYMVITSSRLQQAIDHIVSSRDTVNLRADIVRSICSGYAGEIDAEGADCIMQFAMFGELKYG